jgi:tetratricopeptide (TPR) repeat protein
MNEADQIETLKSLAEVASQREKPRTGSRLASVRVSPGSYLAAASVLTFVSGLLLRSERDMFALTALGLAWFVIPLLAWRDRIEFDGASLLRRGFAPAFLRLLGIGPKKLRLEHFERVETQAVRTLKKGGKVRYRYRTQIIGRKVEFTFASGGKSYRNMVRQLFPLIHDDKMDLRTIELRDYLCEPKELDAEVNELQLASSDVLETATPDFKLGGNKRSAVDGIADRDCEPAMEPARALLLGELGSKLRVAGRLAEAREAFRRALTALPNDGRLLFEFSRLLRSQASSAGDAKLLQRSRAALRLAAQRAAAQPGLLTSIGEIFLEWGELNAARRSLQKASAMEPRNFKARVGLANLALRDGKLAHVINQYRDASMAASDKALVDYARREADYYAQLNDDDEYLNSELRRINWLQHSLRIRRLAARVTNASILVALIAAYFDSSFAGICWSLATSSLCAWILSLFGIRLLGRRSTPRLVE